MKITIKLTIVFKQISKIIIPLMFVGQLVVEILKH